MANFISHVTGAAVVTGVGAVTMQALGFIELNTMMACWMLGIAGGLAPDLDSDDPKALGIIFNIITALVWLLLFAGLIERLSLLEFTIALVVATLFVRVGLFLFFMHATQHRGNFHSIMGGVVLAFMIAAIAGRVVDGFTAWVLALFCFLGFVTHLVMDELFRVNLVNEGCEKPLFSAFKFVSVEKKPLTAAMFVSAFLLWFFTPGHQALIDGYKQRADVAQAKVVNVWPEDSQIFGVEIPDIRDYFEYEFELRPTAKGENLQREWGVTEERFDSTWEKLVHYWQTFVDKVMQLRARPSDSAEL